MISPRGLVHCPDCRNSLGWMMDFDPVLLACIQFALNISFHILFPTITIGLACFLLFFCVRFYQTGDPHREFIYAFWVKIFALTFVLGVVTGIVMRFQFGTNWPGFMQQAGNIAGPLPGYEVLAAFFLEVSFPYRFAHVMVASLITTSFLAAGVSAWRICVKSMDRQPTRCCG